MKYYFVSDLHGCNPDIVKSALNAQGFDAAADTLVVLGDICDRGPYTMQLIDYVLSLPHTIFVRGNHDTRTWKVINGSHYQNYDKHNGVGASLASILGWEAEQCARNLLWLASTELEHDRHTRKEVKDNIEKFYQYIHRTVWGIEFNDLIAIHAWLPYNAAKPELLPVSQWSALSWDDATWSDVEKLMDWQLYPHKKMIIGHWHAWRLHLKAAGIDINKALAADTEVNFGIYEDDHLIAIDPCVNYSNMVNVYVYQSDDEPLIYSDNRTIPFSTWQLFLESQKEYHYVQ